MSFKPLALSLVGIVVAALSFAAGRLSAPSGGEAKSQSQAEGGGRGGSVAQAGSFGGGPVGSSHPGKSSEGRLRTAGGISGSSDSGRSASETDSGSAAEEGEHPDRVLSRTEQLLEKKGLSLFDENYELNPDIKEVLGLSDEEYGKLAQTLQGTLDEIDKLREQSIEVRSRSDSQMFLKIRSFGEKGAEVRSGLQEDLREQLGDERYAAFMLMTDDSLNSEFFEFGRAYQTISYNFYTSENTGTQRVRIVDEVHIPQGSGSYTIIQNKENYDTLPENYATYLEIADGATPAPLPVTPPPAILVPPTADQTPE